MFLLTLKQLPDFLQRANLDLFDKGPLQEKATNLSK